MARTARIGRKALPAAMLAFGLGAVSAAHAQSGTQSGMPPPDFSGANALTRFLLPYSPILFDFAVQGGRSFAEITYRTRDYDPVTRSFVVDDFHIRRDAFDMSVREMRVGQRATLLQGVSVDTTKLELPPQLREGLRRLGRETVSGDVVLSLRTDQARAAYDLKVQVDLPGVAALSMDGTVDGFHLLVPFSDVETAGVSEPPQVVGTLRHASLTYRDAGVMDAVTAVVAEEQGVPPEQLAAGLAAMPQMSVGQLLDGMPGGASPALRAQALAWAKTVEEFMKSKGTLRLALDPAEPVPLTRFQAGRLDEPLIAALNPSLASGATPGAVRRMPAVDPQVDPLGAAVALVKGEGVLQDREAGAAALVKLAESGDLNAVAALAAAFGTGAPPELDPSARPEIYELLLLGRALGTPVSDTALAALAGSMEPTALRAAELEAGAFFRQRTEPGRAFQTITPANVAQFEPGQLCARAYDAYEGHGAPRDFTEAYALALVAAAAGDGLAEALRDDIAAAAADKRLAVSLPDAKARATALWTAYAGAARPAAPSTQQ